MAHMRREFHPRERSRGIMLIEAALVFMVFILLTFGVIEYSWMFMQVQHVTNAARHGVRVGVRSGATNADVNSAVGTQLNTQGITVYTTTLSPPSVFTPVPGASLMVTVTVPYANITLTGVSFIPVPTNLQAAVTMAKEGP